MSVREYIGARYVPLFMGEWDNTKTYEPLSIVQNEGNSYTSRQFVPVGIDIDNEEFWALSGNYNGQIELYRQEVLNYEEIVEGYASSITGKINEYQSFEAMIADESLTVGAYCIVFDTTRNEQYMYTVTDDDPTIEDERYVTYAYKKLDNDLFAVLVADEKPRMQPCDIETVNSICAVANSFIKHNSSFSYGSTGNIFQNRSMTCSAGVEFMMAGIPYEQSPWVKPSSYRIGAAGYGCSWYKDLEDREANYMINAELVAQYLLANGYCYLPNADRSNVRPGDILFMDTVSHDDYSAFMHISHCEVCVGKTATPYQSEAGYNEEVGFICASAGFHTDVNPADTAPWRYVARKHSALEKIVLCARLPIQAHMHYGSDTKELEFAAFTPASYYLEDPIPYGMFSVAMRTMRTKATPDNSTITVQSRTEAGTNVNICAIDTMDDPLNEAVWHVITIQDATAEPFRMLINAHDAAIIISLKVCENGVVTDYSSDFVYPNLYADYSTVNAYMNGLDDLIHFTKTPATQKTFKSRVFSGGLPVGTDVTIPSGPVKIYWYNNSFAIETLQSGHDIYYGTYTPATDTFAFTKYYQMEMTSV